MAPTILRLLAKEHSSNHHEFCGKKDCNAAHRLIIFENCGRSFCQGECGVDLRSSKPKFFQMRTKCSPCRTDEGELFMAKISAQARRASKSRHNSESAPPPLIVSPAILNGVERPVTTAQLAAHLQVTTRTNRQLPRAASDSVLAHQQSQHSIPNFRRRTRSSQPDE